VPLAGGGAGGEPFRTGAPGVTLGFCRGNFLKIKTFQFPNFLLEAKGGVWEYSLVLGLGGGPFRAAPLFVLVHHPGGSGGRKFFVFFFLNLGGGAKPGNFCFLEAFFSPFPESGHIHCTHPLAFLCVNLFSVLISLYLLFLFSLVFLVQGVWLLFSFFFIPLFLFFGGCGVWGEQLCRSWEILRLWAFTNFLLLGWGGWGGGVGPRGVGGLRGGGHYSQPPTHPPSP